MEINRAIPFVKHFGFHKSFKQKSNKVQSEGTINYVDTVSDQNRYYRLPTYINLTIDQQGTQFLDTIYSYGMRFTSIFSRNNLQGIRLICAPLFWADMPDNKVYINVYNQRMSNGRPYPNTRLDSGFINIDDLTLEEANEVFIPLNNKNVGRFFFVTVGIPWDFNQDEDAQNIFLVFGDSLDYSDPFDSSIHRGIAGGFHYQLYWSGISQGGNAPYYANFMIEANVVNPLGVGDDGELTGNYLAQNYPNPLTNETAEIRYSLAKSGYASLKVYNSLGMEVASLVDGFKGEGEQSVSLNASQLPSGTYYYTLKTEGFSQTKALTIAR